MSRNMIHVEIGRTGWRDITTDDEYQDAMTCPECASPLTMIRSTYMWCNQHGWERRYFCCEDSYTHIRLLKSNGCLELSRRFYEWQPRLRFVKREGAE
jgi:hypothetical protein